MLYYKYNKEIHGMEVVKSMQKVVKVIQAVAVVALVALVITVCTLNNALSTERTARNEAEAMRAEAEHVAAHYQQMEEARMFDTSFIDAWCRGDDGKVRMMWASVVSVDGSLITVEDEQGEQWLVDSVRLTEADNIMLWIADNNTPLDVADDIILKVWIEVYE